ncbi:hypothetical protein ACAX43_12395 [Paraburkholderia sp. IW21]|uniref:hypothetical protein n=1 Tax=Paraburkholderia sp. IW21 TaxID=3242488 RepID=UPI00352066BD
MASLFSLMGLNNSSGIPVSLDDEDQQALLQAQQGQQSAPTTGVSALMGVSGDDSTSQDAQPVADATKQGLLNYVGQGASKDQGSDANPSYATDSQKADETASQTAQDDAANASADSSSADTSSDSQSNGDAATTSDSSAASSDGSSDSQPGPVERWLHKVASKAASDPALWQSVMAAGASMMANSRYGTPGLAAVGSGVLAGQQQYNALHQQIIANNMAAIQYQRQAQLAQAQIGKANADTAQTQLSTANIKALQSYMTNPGANGVTPQGILANGGNAETVKSYFPDLDIQKDSVGNVYAINKRTGQQAKVGTQTVVSNTPVTDNVNVYNGSGANGQPNATQTQTGGMAPADVSKAIQPYHEAQSKAQDQADQYDSLMGALQTKDALGSSSGLLGDVSRQALTKLGVYDPNSSIRQVANRMNVTQEFSLLPAIAKPNQFIEKQLTKTQADPASATPEQLLQNAAFNKVMANVHAVDNSARAAYLSANGGNEADLSKPTTITINGMQKTYGKGTSMQQVAEDAKQHFVDYKPPMINPSWASSSNVDDKAIQQALAMAKDPKKRDQLVKAGVLMKPIFGGQ